MPENLVPRSAFVGVGLLAIEPDPNWVTYAISHVLNETITNTANKNQKANIAEIKNIVYEVLLFWIIFERVYFLSRSVVYWKKAQLFSIVVYVFLVLKIIYIFVHYCIAENPRLHPQS